MHAWSKNYCERDVLGGWTYPEASSCTFYDYNETMQTTSIAGSCQPRCKMVIIWTSYEIGYSSIYKRSFSSTSTIKNYLFNTFCSLSKVFFLKNQRSRSAGVVRPFMASIWTIKADEKPLRLYVKGILPRSECSWGRRQQHLSPVEHEAIFTFSKFTSLHCHLLSISIDSDTCCLLFLYTIPRTLYLALGFFHSSWNKKIGPARFLWPPTIHPSNMLSSATLNEFSKEENYF